MWSSSSAERSTHDPWTLALKGDGQPVVLGFGVPQVELGAWRENQRLQLGEDSFRYARQLYEEGPQAVKSAVDVAVCAEE